MPVSQDSLLTTLPDERIIHSMGSEIQEVIKVTATVSRHNSVEDEIDDLLVADLRARIETIVSEDRYRRITAMAF